MSEAKHTPVVVAFDSAYPGSMSERADGNYVLRSDAPSLAAALLEQIAAQDRRLEDAERALDAAHEALREIALAGMSGTGQESEEGMRAWHARRAWEFIGIAARALPGDARRSA
jgi:hypothetical protein